MRSVSSGCAGLSPLACGPIHVSVHRFGVLSVESENFPDIRRRQRDVGFFDALWGDAAIVCAMMMSRLNAGVAHPDNTAVHAKRRAFVPNRLAYFSCKVQQVHYRRGLSGVILVNQASDSG